MPISEKISPFPTAHSLIDGNFHYSPPRGKMKPLVKIIEITIVTFVTAITLLTGVALVISSVAPTKYAMNKDIVIEKSVSDVFSYIKKLKNQNNYAEWLKLDPNIKQKYTGIDGTEGFISAWKSNNKNFGSGDQEVVKIIENKRIDTDLRFGESIEATDFSHIETEKVAENKTRVTWEIKGIRTYPQNLLLLTVNMEKEIGAPLKQSLVNLKTILENQNK